MDNLKYTENGLKFNAVKNPLTLFNQGPFGIRGRLSINGSKVSNIDNTKPLINAIDIDWNGAEVENDISLNTTADLLNWIKSRGSSGGSSETNPEDLLLVYTITAYRWYRNGIIPSTPSRRVGGNLEEPIPSEYATDTTKAFPLNKWSIYALNRPSGGNWILWQTQAQKEVNITKDTITVGVWNTPISISGVSGTPGEDSNDKEFIYKSFTTLLDFSTITGSDNPEKWDAVLTDDYLGPNGHKWLDTPEGVSKVKPFEYESQRKKTGSGENRKWGKFCTPYLRSHFGVNGVDGDGVEYVFALTKVKEAPTVIAGENLNVDEYLPLIRVEDEENEIKGLSRNKTEGEYTSAEGTEYIRCTDDPQGVSSIWKYEWVLKRTKKNQPNEDGSRDWNNYTGEMSLWGNFAEDGKNAVPDVIITIDEDGYICINGERTDKLIEISDGTKGVQIPYYDCENSCPPETGPDNTPWKVGDLVICCNVLYMCTEIDPTTEWTEIGESSGSGNYTHIAYADDVLFLEISGEYKVFKIKGFTVSPAANVHYSWFGICVDNNIDDPIPTNPSLDNDGYDISDNYLNCYRSYKWNQVNGKDGNSVEYIYIRTKNSTAPKILLVNDPNVLDYGLDANVYATGTIRTDFYDETVDPFVPKSGTTPVAHGDRTQDEFYPLVDVTSDSNDPYYHTYTYAENSSGLIESYRWLDDQGNATAEWPYRWRARRTRRDGVWTDFGNVVNDGVYTENKPDYRIVSSLQSIDIASNTLSFNLNGTTLTFLKRVSESEGWTNYSCYYAIYQVKGLAYTKYLSGTGSSITINDTDTFTYLNTDRFIIYISNNNDFVSNAAYTNYLAYYEIKVSKSATPIIYLLTCTPPGVSFRRNVAGDIIGLEKSIVCLVSESNGIDPPSRILPNDLPNNLYILFRESYSGNHYGNWHIGSSVSVFYDPEKSYIYNSSYNAAVQIPNINDVVYLTGIEFILYKSNNTPDVANNDIDPDNFVCSTIVPITSDGAKGIGAGSEGYIITTNNDNAVIDDLTMDNTDDGLIGATLYTITVHKGNVDVTNACTFEVNGLSLPTGMYILVLNNQNWIQYSNLSSNNHIYNTFSLKYDDSYSLERFDPGNYYYNVDIKHNDSTVATKCFRLYVDPDISSDGSYYKLVIEHDSISYNYQETVQSSINPKIRAYLRGNGRNLEIDINYTNNIDNIVTNVAGVANTGYYVVGTLSNTNNTIIKPNGENYLEVNRSKIPYSADGYDFTLYQVISNGQGGRTGKLLDGPETINCIKDGGTGISGYSSVIVRLYKRSDTILEQTNIYKDATYTFGTSNLVFSNSINPNSHETEETDESDNWEQNISNLSGDSLLYMTAATALGNGLTDTIAYNEWSTPIPVSEDGSTPDYNIRTIYLYKYSSDASLISYTTSRYYYDFENEVFNIRYSGDSFLDAINRPGTKNIEGEWSMIINNPQNENLWETHATVVSLTRYDEIEESEWSIPSIVTEKQESIQGNIGKMFYSMGEWNSDTKYPCDDDLRIPMVYYNNGLWNNALNTYGSYYYLNPNYSGIRNNSDNKYYCVNKIPGDPSSKFTYEGNNLDIWVEASNFGLVMTQGIFSEFAKLGSAIVSGDFIYSLNGKIGSTEYNDGKKFNLTINGSTTSVPAYSRFLPGGINIVNKTFDNVNSQNNRFITSVFKIPKGCALAGTIEFNSNNYNINDSCDLFLKPVSENGNTTSYEWGHDINLRHNEGETYVNQYNEISVSDHVKYYVIIKNGLTTSRIADDSNRTETSIELEDIEKNNYRLMFKCLNNASNTFSNVNINLNYYFDDVVFDSSNRVFSSQYSSFKPNWYVDLRTGKMVAGGGNFVVEPDGSVVAAGGNFSIDLNGNISTKVLTFRNTLNCTHGIKVATDGNGTYYSVGDVMYYDNNVWTYNNDDYSNYYGNEDSDIIVITESDSVTHNNIDHQYFTFIPIPRYEIEGKLIEIYNYTNESFELGCISQNSDWCRFVNNITDYTINYVASGRLQFPTTSYLKLICLEVENAYRWVIIERRKFDGTISFVLN